MPSIRNQCSRVNWLFGLLAGLCYLSCPRHPNQAWPLWPLVRASPGEGWAGLGEPLTLPFGRWQALRAASTRLRSAGNIWKKLKEQRKAPGKERGQTWRGKAVRSWGEVWGESRGNSLFHRNLPFGVELHLELDQAGGGRAEIGLSRPHGWCAWPRTLRPGRQALTFCPRRCCGRHWLSAGA